MKKVIAIAFVSLAVLACKKDRTCSCTLTKTGNSTTTASAEINLGGFPLPLADTSFITPVNEVQSFDRKYNKTTRRQAKNNCVSYTEPYSETTITSVPSGSFNLSISTNNKGDRTYKCELK